VGFFCGLWGFQVCTGRRAVKIVMSKEKASRLGGEAVGNWGQCLARSRHPTAQAERIRWHPHLEALQIGASVSRCRRVLAEDDRARCPKPHSIVGARREAASVTSLLTIGNGGGERQGKVRPDDRTPRSAPRIPHRDCPRRLSFCQIFGWTWGGLVSTRDRAGVFLYGRRSSFF